MDPSPRHHHARGGTTSEDGFQGGPTEGFTVDSRREQTLLLVAANFRL
ncbi:MULTISPECIES: hypothetical protein [Myxococcus]|nr:MULTISPECIES: hypothetical protein [Myxococcus]NVJ26979.1 hypothetical protein [Myxococcus sp. AM011]